MDKDAIDYAINKLDERIKLGKPKFGSFFVEYLSWKGFTMGAAACTFVALFLVSIVFLNVTSGRAEITLDTVNFYGPLWIISCVMLFVSFAGSLITVWELVIYSRNPRMYVLDGLFNNH